MIIDILVLVILLISAVIAFLRGFIREVLTIAGVVGGLAAAYFGGPLLIPVMHGWLGVEEGVEPERLFGALPYDVLGNILSYASIFIVVVILLSILSHFLAEGAKNLGLGAIDRTLGFIFGLVRGVVLIGLLYLPVHLFIDEEAKASWFEASQTHFYIEQTSEFLSAFIPEDAVEEGEKGIENFKEVEGTRKKLNEINLLPSEKRDEKSAPATEQGEGYSEEFRDKMDELFEDGSAEDVPPAESGGQ